MDDIIRGPFIRGSQVNKGPFIRGYKVIRGFRSFGGFLALSAGAKFGAVFLLAIQRFLLVSAPSAVFTTK